MKSRELADPVRAAGLKRRRLFLRHLAGIAEHLARTGEVKTAARPHFAQRGEHVMRAVDVHVHRRKAVGKTLRHEALRREVITLVKVVLAQYVKDAGVTFETRRMQR